MFSLNWWIYQNFCEGFKNTSSQYSSKLTVERIISDYQLIHKLIKP